MDNIKRAGSLRRDANTNGEGDSGNRNSGSSTIRAGMLTAPHQTRATAGSLAAQQSDKPYDNSQGVPTTPSDVHPALPSPAAAVVEDEGREKETAHQEGAPDAVKEGLGGWLNSAFGCGPDDPGCNG
jgi:hypothetical protein